jgi:anthranilate synthase/aminodeoxychorismate synthase-like glutamine amidotransferase
LKLLLLDHQDSFSWNLVDLLEQAGAAEVDVLSAVNLPDSLPPCDAVVLSPGPLAPEDWPATLALIHRLAGKLPLVGVCLGMQAIAQALGGRVVRAPAPVHGKPGWVQHRGHGPLAGLPQPFAAMRYHSLAIDAARVPATLQVTATLDGGLPMALQGQRLHGVQFHPESIGTPHGLDWARGVLRWLREGAHA